ncbi:hypothetical protein [Caminibacter pacificus]|uniref:Uncharacterized protein n=1 Tax=Caminibacter pacificus TaxID=1424653 RepID=A0AAJ4RB66_9BACT|nr:hypothetical protein [Caminibacter pacificus]QDD68195.1 hypothetical protein C6V80_10090 [Caminibacter pacificus]ROR38708.1 hypothetical protein EDC58_1923 [Caminibacter pacificus]
MKIIVLFLINSFLLFITGKIIYILFFSDKLEYEESREKQKFKDMLYFLLFVFLTEIIFYYESIKNPKIAFLERILLTFIDEIILFFGFLSLLLIFYILFNLINIMFEIMKK